jgi:hypothetical protein
VRRKSDSTDLSAFGVIDAEIEKKGYLWTETRYLKVRTALMPPSTEMI